MIKSLKEVFLLKKGQVAIFIIIAVLAVGAILSIYFLNRGIRTTERFEETNPQTFIQNCIEDDLKNAVEKVSLQGGVIDPEGYTEYQGNKIQYVCYTAEDFKPCEVQIPFLEQRIESEIEKEITPSADFCFSQLLRNYENKGYSVKMEKGSLTVDLLPKKIFVVFGNVVTVTKGNTQRFDNFNIVLDNNLYELVGISSSILKLETLVGESSLDFYNDNYRWISVEKKDRDDGTKIYIVKDTRTGDKFQFASRSVVWSPGHDLSKIARA
jgi:hypothetical protein